MQYYEIPNLFQNIMFAKHNVLKQKISFYFNATTSKVFWRAINVQNFVPNALSGILKRLWILNKACEYFVKYKCPLILVENIFKT